jgi:hypothetical protein
MNLSTAVVRPGENVASFCVRVPRFQGLASSNMKSLGKLVDVTYNSTTGVRNIPSDMEFKMDWTQRRFNFYIRTGKRDDNVNTKVATKFEKHFADLAKEFPLLRAVPEISFNTDDENDNHYELFLPPRSSIYSSSEYFFRVIGFQAEPRLRTARKDMAGLVGRTAVHKTVYCIINPDDHNPLDLRGVSVLADGTLNDMLPSAPNVPLATPATMPPAMHLQVEFLDSATFMLPGLHGEALQQPATKENAVRLMNAQFERIRNTLGLRTNVFDIVPGAGNTVYIGNRAFPGANVRLTVQFNAAMAEAYGWAPGQQMYFPLDSSRTYDIQVRGRVPDPFEGKYPIIMRMAGFGNCDSYIEGHGYNAVLGYLREKGDKISITTQGIVFDSDQTYVTMQFLNKQREVVTFTEGHEISMLMTFKSL